MLFERLVRRIDPGVAKRNPALSRRAASSDSSSSGGSCSFEGAGTPGVIVTCAAMFCWRGGSAVCETFLPAALRAQ